MFRELTKNRFSIRTIDDARALAVHLSTGCPDPAAAAIGLSELLFNAVEHGSLGITYEEKSQLQASEQWTEELERRLALPENADRLVTVQLEETADEIRFLIRDPGEGFDWLPYMEIDPKRRTHNHGRGIALARFVSFSHMEFRNTGNEVLAVIRKGEPPPVAREPDSGRRRIKRTVNPDRRDNCQSVQTDKRDRKQGP